MSGALHELLLQLLQSDQQLRLIEGRILVFDGVTKPEDAGVRSVVEGHEQDVAVLEHGLQPVGQGLSERRVKRAVVEGVAAAQQPDGFAMAFAQQDTHCRENPDYVTSWMTHGLLEAAGAGLTDALAILRRHYDWFGYAQDELAQFLPPLGGANVTGLPWPGGEPPDPYGAPFSRRDLQTNQGMVHNSRMALSPVGTMRDAAVVADIYAEEWWLQALAARDPKAVWYRHFYPHNYEWVFKRKANGNPPPQRGANPPLRARTPI